MKDRVLLCLPQSLQSLTRVLPSTTVLRSGLSGVWLCLTSRLQQTTCLATVGPMALERVTGRGSREGAILYYSSRKVEGP